MKRQATRTAIAILMSALTLLSSLFAVTAQAGMVTTGDAVAGKAVAYDRVELLRLMDSEGVRQQMLDYGVEPAQIDARIQSLSADELAQLNAQLASLPAGEGVLELAVLVFIIFIITDMLCATDLFPFVNCINK